MPGENMGILTKPFLLNQDKYVISDMLKISVKRVTFIEGVSSVRVFYRSVVKIRFLFCPPPSYFSY